MGAGRADPAVPYPLLDWRLPDTEGGLPRLRAADVGGKLFQYGVEGTRLHRDQGNADVSRSLMLVNALSPVVGYDMASAIDHKANHDGTALREAALGTGYVDDAGLDRIVNPFTMPGR